MDIDDLILGPRTATATTVNSGVASVEILAANDRRRGATITNTDANALYLLLGTGTASATNYTQALLTGEVFVLEQGDYRGAIQGIWAADGAGQAVVSELT